jgi:hypothetical protein
MSEEELRRTGVMSRVAAGVLKLVKEAELPRKVLGLIGKHYSGGPGSDLGPQPAKPV